jgi:hypothetical protein
VVFDSWGFWFRPALRNGLAGDLMLSRLPADVVAAHPGDKPSVKLRCFTIIGLFGRFLRLLQCGNPLCSSFLQSEKRFS